MLSSEKKLKNKHHGWVASECDPQIENRVHLHVYLLQSFTEAHICKQPIHKQ